MAKQTPKPGSCHLCKESLTKRTAATHLKKKHGAASGEERFIIMVDTPYSSPYWMILLAKPTATLVDLDDALRDIWVECCSHLSTFTIEGIEYQAPSMDPVDSFYPTKSKKVKLEKVLCPGMAFSYEYDFGTTPNSG